MHFDTRLSFCFCYREKLVIAWKEATSAETFWLQTRVSDIFGGVSDHSTLWKMLLKFPKSPNKASCSMCQFKATVLFGLVQYLLCASASIGVFWSFTIKKLWVRPNFHLHCDTMLSFCFCYKEKTSAEKFWLKTRVSDIFLGVPDHSTFWKMIQKCPKSL